MFRASFHVGYPNLRSDTGDLVVLANLSEFFRWCGHSFCGPNSVLVSLPLLVPSLRSCITRQPQISRFGSSIHVLSCQFLKVHAHQVLVHGKDFLGIFFFFLLFCFIFSLLRFDSPRLLAQVR